MHTATPDGDSFQELKLDVVVRCMNSSITQRGVLQARRSRLASLPGVGYDSLAHSTDPPSAVSIFFAREGGGHAAQFGVARFAGGSSPGAPADEGGRSHF